MKPIEEHTIDELIDELFRRCEVGLVAILVPDAPRDEEDGIIRAHPQSGRLSDALKVAGLSSLAHSLVTSQMNARNSKNRERVDPPMGEWEEEPE